MENRESSFSVSPLPSFGLMTSTLLYLNNSFRGSMHRFYTKGDITLVFNRVRTFDECAHTTWCSQAILTRFRVVNRFLLSTFFTCRPSLRGRISDLRNQMHQIFALSEISNLPTEATDYLWDHPKSSSKSLQPYVA